MIQPCAGRNAAPLTYFTRRADGAERYDPGFIFVTPGTDLIGNVANFQRVGVHALLIDACFQATQRVLAVTPYFVPDVSLETAMRLAARRGVKIDLCIPAKSNYILADFVRNRSLRALSDAGVSIHLLPCMNHAKAVVFDDGIALCGSCNLDSRSLLLNYESMVVFYDAPEIEWLAD